MTKKKEELPSDLETATAAASRLEEETSGWEPSQVSMPPFWDFDENKVFIGKYVGPREWTPPDGSDKDAWKAHLFQTEDGKQFMLSDNYEVGKNVEKYGKSVWYRFEFRGMKDLSGGRSVRVFDVKVKNLE